MTFEKILADLKARNFASLYLFMGEEAYYIDKLTDYIAKNALTPEEQSFNQTIVYGKDTEAAQVDNMAKRFPMMAEKQVVIVREAQNLKRIDDLVHYAKNPQPSTILVISHKYKSLPKNKKLYKALKKNGVVFESKKLYDNQLPDWIGSYLKQKGRRADTKAIHLLADSLGTDLSKIANEIDKLSINVPQNELITALHIEQNIGISKDFNNFELQNAIVERNVLKANRIINYFAENQKSNPIVLTINSLYSFFSKVLMYEFLQDKSDFGAASAMKVAPFFVKKYRQASTKYPPAKTVRIIKYLREYDLKSKGVNNATVTPGELLRELIFKILH